MKPGTTAYQVAASISEGLARNVLAARVNGEVVDAARPIPADATVQLLTWNDDLGKATFWHSSAHLMAEALEELYPGVKIRHRAVARKRRFLLRRRAARGHVVRPGRLRRRREEDAGAGAR